MRLIYTCDTHTINHLLPQLQAGRKLRADTILAPSCGSIGGVSGHQFGHALELYATLDERGVNYYPACGSIGRAYGGTRQTYFDWAYWRAAAANVKALASLGRPGMVFDTEANLGLRTQAEVYLSPQEALPFVEAALPFLRELNKLSETTTLYWLPAVSLDHVVTRTMLALTRGAVMPAVLHEGGYSFDSNPDGVRRGIPIWKTETEAAGAEFRPGFRASALTAAGEARVKQLLASLRLTNYWVYLGEPPYDAYATLWEV